MCLALGKYRLRESRDNSLCRLFNRLTQTMKLAGDYLLPSNVARLALVTTIHIILTYTFTVLYCPVEALTVDSSVFVKQSLQYFFGVHSDFKGAFGGSMQP